MPDPILTTKVNLPVLRRIFVPRKKILARLSDGIQDGHLLTLVSATAGYGKTTTIRMWVEEVGYPVAWVALEKSDNDLKQFLTYFLVALQQVEDDLGQVALEIVESTQEFDLQQILGLLVRDLVELSQPVILVLEDYHLIENEKIDQFLALILNQAVANLHLVVTTREDPNLPLTRLRVRNQLTEIRAADLSFSLEEADEFFSNVMGVNLTPKDMEVLGSRTEGWAAGLQLAALSLKESKDKTKFVEAFRGTHRHVLDYLITEVLNSQSEEVRKFLFRTSVLDQLSPSLCEAVTGQKSSGKFLQYLENNNLFLIALDEERTWYRYHALFAELLKNQLLQVEPERVDELHERAADWYQKNDFIQKAIDHAFQISNGSKASQLIEKYAMPMIYQGEVATVIEWYDRLPETLMQSSPMLCIGKAWAMALMQRQITRVEAVEQALQTAQDALLKTHADEKLQNLVAGYALSIRAYLMQVPAMVHKQPNELIEISQAAQRLLPQDEKAIRSVNAMNIGFGYLALADLPAAETSFQQTCDYGIAGKNFYAAIYGPVNLIMIAMVKGELKNASQLCEANIDRFNRLLAGRRFPPIGALYVLKGYILLEENLLEEAELEIKQGLSLLLRTGESRAHVKGYSSLARLRCIQGDRSGMLESIKSLEETRSECVILAQSLQHRLSAQEGLINKAGLEEANLWVRQGDIKFNGFSEIASADSAGEITFRTYLNTAHILTRLVARNHTTYSLQDVHNYYALQEKYAEANNLFGWLIEIWIVRALMYYVMKKVDDAHFMIQKALSAAAVRGYSRVFLDEADLMRPLLESIHTRLNDNYLSVYVKRLLEAMPGDSTKDRIGTASGEKLSERELEVLKLLAGGESYNEIGQKLFLSLNTVQFHIKSIYRKLSVNKRTQAIEKARKMGLI